MSYEYVFYDYLVSKKVLTASELDKLKLEFNEDAFKILLYLKEEQLAPSDVLGRLWGDSIGTSYVNLDKTLFQDDAVYLLPEKAARKYSAIPLYKGNAITVATSNITNELIIKEIENVLNQEVFAVFAFPDEIEQAINIQYRSLDNILNISNNIINNPLLKELEVLSKERLKAIAGDQLIVNLTDELILWAIKERATDIHIEPYEDVIRIRYRIDGFLHEKIKLDKALLSAIVTRLKVLANVDIVEKRRPQDGRITYNFLNKNIDIRFSVIPTSYGEKIALRILGHSVGRDIPNLQDLFFSKSVFNSLKRIIESPNGIFFITGPTGSGKTTTLFSVLKRLNDPSVNITTIEDPIEYKLKGINQVQTNEAVGLKFSTALRSFLRQDPDVILIGEIRDVETAKIASQAALTGHLVLATMHTNSSIQAITRLIEIGVEPFLVAPSIIGVMAQRLVRRICETCKESYTLTPEEIEEYFIWDGETEVTLYQGTGCKNCNNTGYYGRIAIHELFIVNEQVRNMITKESSVLEIQKYVDEEGFKNLWYDGLKKVLRGLTTIDELKRVVVESEM